MWLYRKDESLESDTRRRKELPSCPIKWPQTGLHESGFGSARMPDHSLHRIQGVWWFLAGVYGMFSTHTIRKRAYRAARSLYRNCGNWVRISGQMPESFRVAFCYTKKAWCRLSCSYCIWIGCCGSSRGRERVSNGDLKVVYSCTRQVSSCGAGRIPRYNSGQCAVDRGKSFQLESCAGWLLQPASFPDCEVYVIGKEYTFTIGFRLIYRLWNLV